MLRRNRPVTALTRSASTRLRDGYRVAGFGPFVFLMMEALPFLVFLREVPASVFAKWLVGHRLLICGGLPEGKRGKLVKGLNH